MGSTPINQMNYSAVITFFNSPNPALAIESALAQTIEPQEIIVVDDCSNDDFQSLLKKVAHKYKCTYICTPKNLGPAGARNMGVKIANNNIIMIFDDDDISLPERALIHIDCLKSGSDLSYLSSRKTYPSGYSFDAINDTYFGKINSSELAQYLLAGRRSRDFPRIYAPTCCLAFLKDSLGTHEPFDSNLRRLEDVDFALQASEKGLIFSFSEAIGVTRYSSEGSDKNTLIESTAQLEILSKYKVYFKENEFRKVQMWYQIRAHYFSKNYLRLLTTAILFTLRFGMDLRRMNNGLSRITHDFRIGPKGSLDG